MIELENKFLKQIMIEFNGSFINSSNELILIPRTNLYFSLENVENELDLECKLLEWCSRHTYKSEPFSQDFRNEIYQRENLKRLRNLFDYNFTEEEMEKIYCKLGNAVNRAKTIKFIESGLDIKVLGA